jgi:type II restriction/modification system DNA methylase subunit YeeA
VDFGVDMSEQDAAMFEAPFAHVVEHVRKMRSIQRRDAYRIRWWIHAEARPGLRAAMAGLARLIPTPRVAKHRFFVWLPAAVLPDSRLYAICRDDDFTFGVLSSRLHEVWALANASRHGVGNDPTFNSRDCFETFPFPDPEARREVANAARRLNELRENWLNPPEWVDRVPEVVPGYPDRIVAKPGHEADLKKRTLTNLYNQRPAWLDSAHKALDLAVAAAYGWTDYTPAMSEEEILRRLLALNLARSTAG